MPTVLAALLVSCAPPLHGQTRERTTSDRPDDTLPHLFELRGRPRICSVPG